MMTKKKVRLLCGCGSGARKGRCPTCGGHDICSVHGRRKDSCSLCWGTKPVKKCAHNKRKDRCKLCCSAKHLCPCKKLRRDCPTCEPMLASRRKVRRMMRDAFSRTGQPKKMFTEEYLGCTMDEFFVYLEKKIKLWNDTHALKISLNRFSIHLDHIKPISKCTSEEDFKKLAHYTNIQPLPCQLNLMKGNKWNNLDDQFWNEHIIGNPDFLCHYWPNACPPIHLATKLFEDLYILANSLEIFETVHILANLKQSCNNEEEEIL